MITIVDFDMGNVGSIFNMLQKLGQAARISRVPEDLFSTTALILPGVGSFDEGMRSLAAHGLNKALHEAVVQRGIPILGICLGMQLLSEGSEEGQQPGLGWIPGNTTRFRIPQGCSDGLRIPHMGWSRVTPVASDLESTTVAGCLFARTDFLQQYYFVHSYHVCCADPGHVIATANHGYTFAAAIGRGHIVGTQFHPEKSHKFGFQLMRNFVDFVSEKSALSQ
jgi:glutamine amidotransferase